MNIMTNLISLFMGCLLGLVIICIHSIFQKKQIFWGMLITYAFIFGFLFTAEVIGISELLLGVGSCAGAITIMALLNGASNEIV